MNNPITSAFSSIGRNIAGLGNGSNPAFSPQITSLLGFNIPGIPLISSRDLFLTQMESWFTSIPLNSQWIVLINQYPACVNTAILQGLEYTDGAKKGFDVDQALKLLTSFPLQKIAGCLFAQGCSLPSESFGVDYIRIENNRGFVPGLIAKDREAFGQLSIDFLETNTSFADFVVRPWIIAGSHYGFVARNPGNSVEAKKNVKTTVQILQYTKSVQNVSMIPRKIWTFYNCAPINIEGDVLEYSADTSYPKISTKWVYSHYTVENNLYFPLTTLINRIAKGQFPNITNLSQTLNNFNPAGLF